MREAVEGRGRARLSSYLFLPLVLAVLSLASGLVTQACREQSTFEVDRNMPPETILSGAPGDSTTTFYWTHLYWYGVDPDGEVVAYEFAITDSVPDDPEAIEWHRTTRTDSLFAIPVEESQEILGRRFYVRAIDNEGKEDPTPAWTFFTVRDNEPPRIEFTRAIAVGPNNEIMQITSTDMVIPTDTIPAGWRVEFAWRGEDADVALDEDGNLVRVGRVMGYSYHLAPIESGYLGGTLADTVAVYDNLISGSYTMFVRGIDDAGFSALNPTVRTFVWNKDPDTFFEKGFREETGDSLFHFFDQDDREYFDGDTIPLGAANSVRTWLDGWDPDDPTGQGQVTGFEVRFRINGGGFPWQPVTDPDRMVEQTISGTGDYEILGRCRDLMGRRDGTPAILRFYVNKVPKFVQEVRIGSVVREQKPMPGDTLTLAEVANGLPIAFYAIDPDPLPSDGRMLFSYRFVSPSSYYSVFPVPLGEGAPLPGGVIGITTTVEPTGGQSEFVPGEYVLEVTVKENRDRGIRSAVVQVPFLIVAR
jgi:hypothetical protein